MIRASSATKGLPAAIHSRSRSRGELARDDGHRHVVAPLVAEHLRVTGDAGRLGHGHGPEPLAQAVVEVDEVLGLEQRPVRQRHLAVDLRQLVVDGLPVAQRTGIDVDHAGDAFGPGVSHRVRDRTTAAVARRGRPWPGSESTTATTASTWSRSPIALTGPLHGTRAPGG